MRDNWSTEKIEQFGEVISGGTPSTSVTEFWDGEIVWITPADLSKVKFPSVTSSLKKITEKGLKGSSATLIPAFSIVMSSRAPIGYFAVPEVEFTTNQGCKSIKLNNGQDPIFHYYNFLQNVDVFKRRGEGTTFAEISKKEIEKLKFNFPPLPQQRKIAKILSTCDTVIAKTEEAIAKYQAIKQGMMHDLFTRGIDLSTGKLRPKYQDAPELYKESELGMIPKDWEVKRLGEFGSFKKGSNIPKYLLTPNGVGCILYGQLYTTFHDVIKQSYTKIPENHVKGMSPLNQGDILFAGSGETHEEIGKCAVLLSEEEIYAGGDIVILSLSENYCKPYFGYLLNFEPIQKQKAKLGQGSSVIHIYSNHLGSLKLSLPNKMEQEAIYQKIQSISEKISFEESTLSKYHQIKSGLMQDLLSGKVEVSVSKEEEIVNA